MSNAVAPKLAAPGAGLPAVELFIGKTLFALKRRMGTREEFIAKFRDERAEMKMLVRNCLETRRGERVLVPRLRGLEDSSRHWSVWMTLDHLRVTNLAFTKFIVMLAAGKVPNIVVSTADVKPDPEVDKSIEDAFEESCDQLLKSLGKVTELKTRKKFNHPWFGPLDAYGWLALAALHMGIHRAQIDAITRGLPA